MELSIVIPAYNESRKIERDIKEASAFLERHSIEGEILVVDDGSKDDTVTRVEALRSAHPRLSLLSYGVNRGKGYAVRFGVAASRGRYVMFADSGLCVPYEMAMVGLTQLRMNLCDISLASRRERGSQVAGQPLYRRIGSRLNSILVRTVMGIPWNITDTQCGFKMFQGEVARQIYGQLFTDRMMFDIEMLLRATRSHLRILCYPVPWQNDADTRFNPFWGQMVNFRELWAIKRGVR